MELAWPRIPLQSKERCRTIHREKNACRWVGKRMRTKTFVHLYSTVYTVCTPAIDANDFNSCFFLIHLSCFFYTLDKAGRSANWIQRELCAFQLIVHIYWNLKKRIGYSRLIYRLTNAVSKSIDIMKKNKINILNILIKMSNIGRTILHFKDFAEQLLK